MKQEVIITADGSSTVLNIDKDITYHSRHGAIQESRHVFIESGLNHYIKETGNKHLSILEVGFGTGLNALLTAIHAKEHEVTVNYHALEPYPLNAMQLSAINHGELLNEQDAFRKLHSKNDINAFINLAIHNTRLEEFTSKQVFDIIYFDAFAPNAQPELWTVDIFEKLNQLLKPGGILTTYCSKSIVRKALQDAGFAISKLPGPPGKREIIRTQKSSI